MTVLLVMMIPAEGWISSPYGLRVDPFTGRWGFHRGVDIANHYASAVKAVENGIVTFAGKRAGHGRLVVLQHDDDSQTYYGHLGRIFVKTGDDVARGQLVGWMGMTGRATGAHVHYEVRENGAAVNPLNDQDSKIQIANFRFQISDFKFQNSDFRFQLDQFWAILNEGIFSPIL